MPQNALGTWEHSFAYHRRLRIFSSVPSEIGTTGHLSRRMTCP